MLTYSLKRLAQLVPVVFGITVLVFSLFHLTADPAEIILGMHATEAAKANFRELNGLNDPLPTQYLRFVGNLFKGDLGNSWYYRGPVAREIAGSFPHTIELALAAMVISTVMGLTIGILAAVKRYSIFDYAGNLIALLGLSIPVFWLGLILIRYFGVTLGWLPLNGRLDPTLLASYNPPHNFYLLHSLFTGNWPVFKDGLKHLILPAVTLSAVSTALVVRMTRGALLEILGQDYVRTARAKGLAEKSVIYRHALKNALIPVITVLGLQLGTLLGGAILTETVFTWPGLGTLAITGIQNNDLPLVQGTVLVIATLFVVVNLAVDLTYAWLDPRIHYS